MKTIEVVAAIIHKDHKILATQRGYGDFKDGWEFPGGKMEKVSLRKPLSLEKFVRSWKLKLSQKTYYNS